jgi:cell division protein FtsW (lipid II flippase)
MAAPEEAAVEDLGFIGLTILVFAVLYLILKGVERFER